MRYIKMYQLLIHEDAERDLGDLLADDPVNSRLVEAFIEDLADDQDALASMVRHQAQVKKDGGRWFSVSRLLRTAQWKVLWRLKVWKLNVDDLLDYRLIYTHDPDDDALIVLAIMRRDRNYEQDTALFGRIGRALRDLGLWP